MTNCKKYCTNHKVCSMLGQCMLTHPLMDDEGRQELSERFVSIRKCLKVFERLMPSLKRIGKRKYYAPEPEDKIARWGMPGE